MKSIFNFQSHTKKEEWVISFGPLSLCSPYGQQRAPSSYHNNTDLKNTPTHHTDLIPYTQTHKDGRSYLVGGPFYLHRHDKICVANGLWREPRETVSMCTFMSLHNKWKSEHSEPGCCSDAITHRPWPTYTEWTSLTSPNSFHHVLAALRAQTLTRVQNRGPVPHRRQLSLTKSSKPI